MLLIWVVMDFSLGFIMGFHPKRIIGAAIMIWFPFVKQRAFEVARKMELNY